LIVVEIKFTAPRIDDTPARWSEKIARYLEQNNLRVSTA
jgi:hypothetical protein